RRRIGIIQTRQRLGNGGLAPAFRVRLNRILEQTIEGAKQVRNQDREVMLAGESRRFGYNKIGPVIQTFPNRRNEAVIRHCPAKLLELFQPLFEFSARQGLLQRIVRIGERPPHMSYRTVVIAEAFLRLFKVTPDDVGEWLNADYDALVERVEVV